MRACRLLTLPLLLAVVLQGGVEPGQQEAPKRREQTLLFVGDIMLSRAVGAKMESADDWTHPFQKIADTLAVADLTFGNLECPVSDAGRNQHHLY